MSRESSCSIFVNKAKRIFLLSLLFCPGSLFCCLSFFSIPVVFAWFSCYEQVCEKLLFSGLF